MIGIRLLTNAGDSKRSIDNRSAAARHAPHAILCLILALGLPTRTWAQAYPNGAFTSGSITQTWSINGMLRFVVQGTLDDGTTGSQAFWIDSTVAGGSLRVANILSAAAQGKSVQIFNFGTTYSSGGQTGYLSSIEIVSY